MRYTLAVFIIATLCACGSMDQPAPDPDPPPVDECGGCEDGYTCVEKGARHVCIKRCKVNGCWRGAHCYRIDKPEGDSAWCSAKERL
jgi:hypothetical protein